MADLDFLETAQAPTKVYHRTKRPGAWGPLQTWLAVAAIAVLAIAGALVYQILTAPAGGNEIRMRCLAEEEVRGRLKCPSTAEFIHGDCTWRAAKKGREYTLVGAVDAQNSFGAKVRMTWAVVIHWDAQSGAYEVRDVATHQPN